MNTVVIGTNMTRMPLELRFPGLTPLEAFFPHHSFATFGRDQPLNQPPGREPLYAESLAGERTRDSNSTSLISQLWSASTDLIVVDLIDERFSLAVFPSGAVRPLTDVAIASFPEGAEYHTIPTASEEHYQLWEAGWVAFLAYCESLEIRSRVVIHETYLALISQDGIELRNAPVLERVNGYLSRLYDRVRLDFGADAFAVSGTPDSTRSDEPGPDANPLSSFSGSALSLTELVDSKLADIQNLFNRATPDVIDALREAHTAVDLDSIVMHSGQAQSPPALAFAGFSLTGPRGSRATRHGDRSIRVEIPLPETRGDSNLLGVRFKLEGFDHLSMSYAGDLVGDTIRGLRFRHLLQGVWHTEAWSFRDPSYLISNRWPEDGARRVRCLVLELNGLPIPDKASVSVEWVAAARGSALDLRAGQGWNVPDDVQHRSQQDEVIGLLHDYLKSSNPFYESQAEVFRGTGRFPIYQHSQSVDWPAGAYSPVGTEALGTYRYLHHSLALATSLLLVARERNDLTPAVQARDLANQWLDDNFFSRPDDPIYAWYDHGTPMRVLALLLLWHTFREQRDKDHRFFTRLENALDAQGHLLASESFYAQYQPVRHQNHAWFQDIGLIALAAVRGGPGVSERWAEIGIRRLDDQFTHLIVDEGEFAIWSENSLGYHIGLISLIRFSRKIVKMLGMDPWSDLTKRMDAWTALVRYPDGRFPAIGDTIPAPPAPLGNRLIESTLQGAHLWPTAGYAMASGVHETSSFRLFQVASSVNLVHKQSDNGSFTLWFDEVEWLVDPGLISYDPDDGPATYVRGPWAHNAIVVEDLPYSIHPGLCTLSGNTSEDSFSFTTEHSSFEGAEVKRTLEGNLSSLFVRGTDRVIGTRSSEVYTVFHAGPDISVEQTSNGLRLCSPRSAFSLVIEVAGDIEVASGWNGDGRTSSVQSSGLASWVPTTSALVRHTSAQGLPWVIRAESASSSAMTNCDHEAVGLLPRTWSSVAEFTDSPDLEDGIHSIRIDHRAHLDVAIRDLPAGELNSPLVVFFSGAVTTREKTRPPFFAGNSLTRRLQIPWVSLSDPIFQLDSKTTLGWYSGYRDSRLQDVVTSLLERLSKLSRHGVLLVGGSGGGFASLYYAARVGARARAFVWNPQIEILDYAQGAVSSYLESAGVGQPFSPLHRREEVVSELKKAGIDHTATNLRDAGGVLVLQNASDYHVIAQLAPLISRESFPATGPGRYATDAQHILQLESWGTGHEPLPIDATEHALRHLLTGASMQSVGDAVRKHFSPSLEQLQNLPRDLSAERQELRSAFRATVTRVDSSTVSVFWSITGRERGNGGVFVNVFSVSENSAPLRLFGDLDGHRINATESLDTNLYRIVLRDGFGTIITSVDTPISGTEAASRDSV